MTQTPDGPNRSQGLTPLAKADQPLSLDEWPPEGRTLADIVEQLYGPAASLIDVSPDENAIVSWSPDRKTIVSWYHPLEAIAQPLLHLWNSGALIAKGRRGDPFLSPIEIPAPSTVWVARVVDLTRSVIEDPIGHGMIYDLRFFLQPKAEPKSTAGSSHQELDRGRGQAATGFGRSKRRYPRHEFRQAACTSNGQSSRDRQIHQACQMGAYQEYASGLGSLAHRIR